jgi:subtilisin family serine protease
MNALDLVNLTPLMQRTNGKSEITIGLIDGPVALNHPDLANAHVRFIKETKSGACARITSAACVHGTFVAGILCGKRHGVAPAICPSCTLLIRPIFGEENEQIPSATPEVLASAILETVKAGARVINISAALAYPSTKGERCLEEVLDYAVQRGVIVVAAAGNQGMLGGSVITRHSWVIPVVACDFEARPLRESNLGSSIGRRGISVPAEAITSLGAAGKPVTFGGTSAATPFVTGAIALLQSEFPHATAAQIKFAVTQHSQLRRHTVVPPLLNVWNAYQILANTNVKDYQHETARVNGQTRKQFSAPTL